MKGEQIFITLTFLALSIFCLGFSGDQVRAQNLGNEPMVTLTAEEQAWLVEHPEIVLGIPTTYPPISMRTSDNTFIGYAHDLYEEISQRLNIKIRLHAEDSWLNIQDKAKNREIDGLALGGKHPSRAILFNATEAVLLTYRSVFARSKSEYQIKNFSDLDGMRIGYKTAARPTIALLEKLSSAVLRPYGDNEGLTQALLSQEIDVIVAWASYDYWRKQRLQGIIDNIFLIVDYPINFYIHIRKDWPELVPILNKALVAMQHDALPRIRNKWFGEWPKSIIDKRVHLTPEEQAWLRENPHIRLATLTNQPPFSMLDAGGSHTGILSDILALLNDAIGQKIETELVSESVSSTHAVAKKEGIYGSASILGTPRHDKEYLMTDAYMETPFYIFTRVENRKDYRLPIDLIGKRVSIPRNHRGLELFLEQIGGVKRVLADTPLEQMQQVISGEADALIGYFTYPYLVNKYLQVDLVMAFIAESDRAIRIGVNPEHPVLHGILNKAIATIGEEKIASITAKWTGASRQEAPRVNLTEEEKDWLAVNRMVRVRIADYPPYQIVRDNESVEGVAVEYLNYIEDLTGIQFEYEVTDQPFAEFLDDMKKKKGPDMTAVIAPTPERENYISFSEPYIYSPYVIFVQEQANPIFDISGLTGKLLAVPRGFVVQEQLVRDYPDIRLALFDSDEDALHAVATGQADAYIGNLTVASHIIHRRGFSNLQVTAASPFKEHSLSMGNRTDWPEFTSIINKALASIKEDEKNAIRNKYLAIKYEQGIEKTLMVKWVSIVLGLTLGILAIFLFWNRRLAVATSKRKDAEERLLTTFDNMPIAAVMINHDDSMYLHNKRFLELFGYTLEDIPHLSDWWVKAYPEEEYRKWVIETWNACLQRSIEIGENIEAKEYKVTCKNGDVRDMEISGHFLGDRYLATLIDNTERNQSKAEIMQAKEAADNANQAKSIFLANMSHELRTPLNAILGFSRMLAQKSNASADDKEKLSIINRSGRHLLSMINDVLDLTKIEAGRVELQEESFDLSALIKEVSVMVQPRASEKGLSIREDIESVDFQYIKTDLGKLRQILINLLSNAVKFTDEGGVIIRCATEKIPDEPNHCRVVIEVEDTGPGIEPDRLESIFEPFVQELDVAARKGTGLGLSITKRCAEIMGGTIEVESEVGIGSTFRVQVVAEITEATDIKTYIDDRFRVVGISSSEKTWRVLVVDDNRDNLILMTTMLETVGFSVIEAQNGKEAVELFERESPDLVWMDIRMPVMDGYEATRQIRQRSGGDTVPIIAITASALSDQRQGILSAGCNDMVIKPFHENDIFEPMARFLDLEYIYETEIASEHIDGADLTSVMLSELPPELLQDLNDACLTLDRESILGVITRIESETPDVAKGLQNLLDNFQIERILELLEKI